MGKSYIDKRFFQSLKKDYKNRETERKRIIGFSNIILNNSKKIIFALHREDFAKAEADFAETEKTFQRMEKQFGTNRIFQEPSFKAAVEEYAEAKFFYQVLQGKKIKKITEGQVGLDGYIGGLSDLTGELVRFATNKAAKGEVKEVEKAREIITEVVEELVEFDLTGYLRNKYDQAKTNLKKIEHINYEMKTR